MKVRNLSERTINGMQWMMSGNGIQTLLRAGLMVVLARLITPEEFGVVAAALVVVSFSNIISQLGVGQAMVQRPVLTERHVRTGFVFSLATGALFFAVVWLGADAIAALFAMPALVPVLRVLSFSFLLMGPSTTAQMLLQRELRFRRLAYIETMSFLIGYAVVAVVLAWLGMGAMALAIAHLVRVVLRGVAFIVAQPHPIRPLFDPKAARELFTFGTGFTLGKFFNFIALQGDYFVVGRMMGSAALGIYSRAYELMVMPATLFGRVIDTVLFPVMSKVQEEPARLGNGFRRGLSFVALVTMPTGLVMTMLAPELVLVLLGDAWLDAVVPLRVLAIGTFCRTSYKVSESVMRATGAVYARAAVQVIYALFVVLGAYLGRPWGLGGVSVGVLGAIVVNFVLMTALAAREAHVGLGDLWRVHAPVLVLSCLVALPAALTASLLRGLELPSLVTLLAALAAAALAAAGLLKLYPDRLLGPNGRWVMGSLSGMLARLTRSRRPALAVDAPEPERP